MYSIHIHPYPLYLYPPMSPPIFRYKKYWKCRCILIWFPIYMYLNMGGVKIKWTWNIWPCPNEACIKVLLVTMPHIAAIKMRMNLLKIYNYLSPCVAHLELSDSFAQVTSRPVCHIYWVTRSLSTPLFVWCSQWMCKGKLSLWIYFGYFMPPASLFHRW